MLGTYSIDILLPLMYVHTHLCPCVLSSSILDMHTSSQMLASVDAAGGRHSSLKAGRTSAFVKDLRR